MYDSKTSQGEYSIQISVLQSTESHDKLTSVY